MTFSAIGPSAGHQHCQRRGRAPAVAALRDLGQAILLEAESTDRDDPAAAILDRGDRVTERDRRAPAAMAADDQVFPAAATDREAGAKAGCDRIDPVVEIAQVDPEMATDLDDQVMAIAQVDPEMATDPDGPATVIVLDDRVIVPVRVAAANSGGREIDRDVPVIDPIGRIVRTIVLIAVPTGTSGKIGETIVGPT